MPIFGGASEKCTTCSKTVYLTEKIVVEDKEDRKTFHKACLTCTHCKKVLSLGNYASMGGVMYCKPHFKQLFATKGNYDEGFGKTQHKANWAPAAAPAAPSSASFVPVESTGPAEKKEAPAAVASRFKSAGSNENCAKCTKTVYAIEKIIIEDKDNKIPYHKACFRCTQCQVQLTLGNYASNEGEFFCKPHYKQLFSAKGAFDEKTATPAVAVITHSTQQFIPVDKTTETTAAKKETPTGIASRFKSNAEKCTACTKTVYATERIAVEDKDAAKVFHKTCLKCQHCQKQLSLGNYAGMGGQFFCKPHFKQLFATKGNYDEGFGKTQHKAKWISQEDQDAAATTTSTSTSTTTSSHHEEESRVEHEKEPEREVEPVHVETKHVVEEEEKEEDDVKEVEVERESEPVHVESKPVEEEKEETREEEKVHSHEEEVREEEKEEEEVHTSSREEPEEETRGADVVEDAEDDE